MKDLNLLGLKVKDVITGMKGVVTSVSYDVAGCIQGLVRPEGTGDNGKLKESYWFDTKRLKVLSKVPVVEQPNFEFVPGGEDLPTDGQR